MGTQFSVPSDEQWSELPRSSASRFSMSVGWTVLIVWLVGFSGYFTWEFMRSDEPMVAKVLAFGGWTGIGLLLLGVALDRLKAMRTDRYRGIEK